MCASPGPSALSFDEHVDQVLDLINDDRQHRTARAPLPAPPRTVGRRLTLAAPPVDAADVCHGEVCRR